MKQAVFVVESPGPEELVLGRSEAELLEKSLRLHQIPVVVIRVLCDNDMRTAISVFKQLAPRLLHLSGHGEAAGKGIVLTDGSVWPWSRILEQFSFNHETSYLFASACGSFRDEHLLRALDASTARKPKAVIGFESDVSWSSSALASVLLYQALEQDSRTDIFAAMLGAYVAIGVDLTAYFIDAIPSRRRVSGSSLLTEFVRSLIARDRTAFEYLITERGLLIPDKWTTWWDESDENKREIQRARAAVDANPIARAAVESAAKRAALPKSEKAERN